MAAPMKIQLIGHSYVSRLKAFIKSEPALSFDLGLSGRPLIQFSGYPGATVDELKRKLEMVSDLKPDIVILVLGTNNIYHASNSVEGICSRIMDIVDYVLSFSAVSKVVVFPCLHRCPSNKSRFPVDIPWFNDRADALNSLLSTILTDKFPTRAVKTEQH